MAKYTPTLLGQDTDVNIGAFFQGGFIDAGADQLNQAIQNNVKVVTEAKNKKFEQAQSLRDGIVSGHFSDDMAGEIGGYIEQLTDMPTYSKAYASTLASANAKLGIMVAKQAKITTEMEQTTTDFDADPSSKYYDPNLSARLHDQINGDEENGIVGTGIDTSSANIQDALTSFKNDKTNIKDGVVRTDFQSKLGEIVQKIEDTGGIGNVNSEFASFTTTTGGQKFVTGYTYDAKNRMYVPAFDKTKLPPMGLVNLYRGIDDAAATLMDDYVNEQHKENSNPGEVLNATAKETYEQQFVLSEMKKLTPGGAIDNKTDREFRNRPQDPSSGSGAAVELQVKAEVVTNLLNNVDQLKNLDLSQLPGGTDSVPFAQVDTNGDGNMTQMLDISSFQKGKYNLGRFSTEDLATGAMKDTWGYPSKTYMEIDKDSGERTLYFEGSDANGDPQYTVYNDKTADQFVQNIKGVWGSGAGGQKYYDAWQHIAKKKGVLSRDASNNKQILETGVTTKGQAAAIVKQKKAEDQAQEAGQQFDSVELTNSLMTSDKPAIKKALQPINNMFAKKGFEKVGLKNRSGKQLTEKRVKFILFEQDGGTSWNNMAKTYGKLSYKVIKNDGSYGPIQTTEYKTSEIIGEVSGGQGEFNLNQEK
jgi:hypothetical protein